MPRVKIGNYRQNVEMDPEGILKSVADKPKLGKLSKVESDYLKGAKNKDSAEEAIRRTRISNRGKKLGR